MKTILSLIVSSNTFNSIDRLSGMWVFGLTMKSHNHCTTGGYIQSIPSPCSSHSSIRDWTWVAGAESLTIVLPRIIWHQLSNHYTINSEVLSLSGIVAQKSVLLTASKSLNRSDLGCLPCRVCLSLRNFVDILLLMFRSPPTSINSAGRLLGYYFWLGYLWQMAKIIIKIIWWMHEGEWVAQMFTSKKSKRTWIAPLGTCM